MELVAIEVTRIIQLVQVHRPAGQLYLPEAAGKLIDRYQFAKFPTLDDLSKPLDYQLFSIGKFADTQIQELRIYGDGIIVEARSNSKILDAFVEDLFGFIATELGLVKVITSTPETYYESAIVVRAESDLATAMGIKPGVAEAMNQLLAKSDYEARPYLPTGFILDSDAHEPGGRRKPMRCTVERRIGVPFAENVFYSTAPLPTDDHLAFLGRVEALAR